MNDGLPSEVNESIFSSIFRRFSGKRRKEDDVTGEEIKDMVQEGHEQGVLNENEAEMINNIFEFCEKNANDVMTHRKSIIFLDSSATIQDAFDFIMNDSRSRYPVVEDDVDNIVGILHIRDLLKVYVDEENRSKTISELKHQIMFDAYYIPETRSISVLFKEMQSKKIHMAVVVDEYGQTSGIITMEDILEEIVGNIQDEYDDEEEEIAVQADGSYMIDGKTSLEDIAELFDITFDCEDIDTINGYMIYKMGKIPDEHEQFEIECGGICFKAEAIDNKMITKVRALKVPQSGGKNE